MNAYLYFFVNNLCLTMIMISIKAQLRVRKAELNVGYLIKRITSGIRYSFPSYALTAAIIVKTNA